VAERDTAPARVGCATRVPQAFSLEVDLLDGEQAEQALVMMKDRNLIVHAYTDALAEDVCRRIPAHAAILARWLEAMQGR
jgi:uncharacterized protein YutE (UPF0331/DUF86 family)